jgi:two-component system, OmpR family, alkaline phosphatase synthesis response regulator PhoP
MKSSGAKRILVIEDDVHIAEGLKLNLSLHGYEVSVAENGVSGLRKWRELKPDLIVLDIMLPVIDGLSVLQSVRLEDERVPILILSAKAEPDDKIKGLSCGVDDYLSKPFNLEEFLLRVERLLVRASWSMREDVLSVKTDSYSYKKYSFGGNTIDFEKSVAICRAGKIVLTEQEIKLLKLFIANRGKTLSRKKLLEIGWGYTGITTTRTVDNFIVRFRKYFEVDPRKPRYFKSLRLVGYLFDH